MHWLTISAAALLLVPQGGEFAPLRLNGSPTPRPLEQILEQAEAGPDGWISERHAEEISETLETLAAQLTAQSLSLTGIVHPGFRGTPLEPSADTVVRAASGIEVSQGTPPAALSVTADKFEAELTSLIAGFTAVHWAK